MAETEPRISMPAARLRRMYRALEKARAREHRWANRGDVETDVAAQHHDFMETCFTDAADAINCALEKMNTFQARLTEVTS